MSNDHEAQLREQYGNQVESRVVEIRAAYDDEEDRAADLVVEGYAARFNEVTDLGYFKEQIATGAFDNVLDNDVRFLFNHKGMPLARTSNGTLEMEVREEGLYTRAVLSDTQQGRDLYKAIKRGDINQMSFAFTIERDAMDSDTNTRTVQEVKSLLDVSAVSYPAYPTTTLEARQRAAVQEPTPEPTEIEESAPEAPETVSEEVRTFDNKPNHPMNINDLKGQRAAYYEEFVAIGQTADQEGRAMTEAEQERADTLDGHITAIDAKIKHKQREQEMVKRVAYAAAPSTSETDEIRATNYKFSLSRAVQNIYRNDKLEGAEAEWQQESQREMRNNGLQSSGNIGIPSFALTRSAADNFTSGALNATTDGAGFVSVDVPAAIEALRAPSIVESLGAQVINAQGHLKFPRISSKAVSAVAGEVSDVDSATMELDQVTMTPERAASNLKYSKQLLIQGGATVDQLIATDLRRSLTERIDLHAFSMIMADTDVDDQSTAGGTDTAVSGSLAVAMEAAVLAAGGDLSNAHYVLSPESYKHFKTTALISQVKALVEGNALNGYQMHATPHLADETAGSVGQAIFGNFSQGLLLAYFGGIDILVDPFTLAQNAQVALHCTRYFDTAVRQPGAFSIVNDVKAAS